MCNTKNRGLLTNTLKYLTLPQRYLQIPFFNPLFSPCCIFIDTVSVVTQTLRPPPTGESLVPLLQCRYCWRRGIGVIWYDVVSEFHQKKSHSTAVKEGHSEVQSNLLRSFECKRPTTLPVHWTFSTAYWVSPKKKSHSTAVKEGHSKVQNNLLRCFECKKPTTLPVRWTFSTAPCKNSGQKY